MSPIITLYRNWSIPESLDYSDRAMPYRDIGYSVTSFTTPDGEIVLGWRVFPASGI